MADDKQQTELSQDQRNALANTGKRDAEYGLIGNIWEYVTVRQGRYTNAPKEALLNEYEKKCDLHNNIETAKKEKPMLCEAVADILLNEHAVRLPPILRESSLEEFLKDTPELTQLANLPDINGSREK